MIVFFTLINILFFSGISFAESKDPIQNHTNQASYTNEILKPKLSKDDQAYLEKYLPPNTEIKKSQEDVLQNNIPKKPSIFAKSGGWIDVSWRGDSFHRHFHNSVGVSLGFIKNGFMLGTSFSHIFPQTYIEKTLLSKKSIHNPGAFEIAGVIGYRIAPDKGVGARFMLHTGYGFHNQYRSYEYILIMPEIKMDIKLGSVFMLTMGLAYRGMVHLGPTPVKPMSSNNWDSLLFTTGLALVF